jgi:hypothetical protein
VRCRPAPGSRDSAPARLPGSVPDPRALRGRRHPLIAILAVAAAAVLAGACSMTAIAEWAAEAPQPVRAALGARRDGRQVHLLAAMDHATRAVLAQRQVDGAPGEVPAFQPLLDGLDLAGRSSPPTRCRPTPTPPSSAKAGPLPAGRQGQPAHPAGTLRRPGLAQPSGSASDETDITTERRSPASWPGRTLNASRHLRHEVCATSARRTAHPVR